MGTIYEDLAQRLRREMVHHARVASPPVMRFTVVTTGPLVLDQVDGDLVLTEGDPDFTIAHTVDLAVAAVGDAVLVDTDAAGDYIATHVVKRGND